MAAQTRNAPAAEAKAEAAESETPKSYTLYHADGRKRTTSDVSTVVALEFDGWSQTDPNAKKKS